MASYQIPAIEAFDFSTPTEWPNWIRRFERFRNASGIADKSQESQIDTLIYSMGDKADDILQSFNLSEEDLKSILRFRLYCNSLYSIYNRYL